MSTSNETSSPDDDEQQACAKRSESMDDDDTISGTLAGNNNNKERNKEWRCHLYFNQAPVCSDNVDVVDLCSFLVHDLSKPIGRHYPPKTQYMFPKHFCGSDSYTSLTTAIKIAAVMSGYGLRVMNRVNGKSANPTSTTNKNNNNAQQQPPPDRQMAFSFHCYHQTLFRKQDFSTSKKPRGSYKRKISSKPFFKQDQCSFLFTVFMNSEHAKYYPGRWFLRFVPYSREAEYNLHRNHAPFEASVRQAPIDIFPSKDRIIAAQSNQLDMLLERKSDSTSSTTITTTTTTTLLHRLSPAGKDDQSTLEDLSVVDDEENNTTATRLKRKNDVDNDDVDDKVGVGRDHNFSKDLKSNKAQQQGQTATTATVTTSSTKRPDNNKADRTWSSWEYYHTCMRIMIDIVNLTQGNRDREGHFLRWLKDVRTAFVRRANTESRTTADAADVVTAGSSTTPCTSQPRKEGQGGVVSTRGGRSSGSSRKRIRQSSEL